MDERKRVGLGENERCLVKWCNNCCGDCLSCVAGVGDICDVGDHMIRYRGSNYISMGN